MRRRIRGWKGNRFDRPGLRKIVGAFGSTLIEVPLLIRELRRVLDALARQLHPEGELAILLRSAARWLDRGNRRDEKRPPGERPLPRSEPRPRSIERSRGDSSAVK